MNLIFKSVRLHNFMSFEDAEVVFDNYKGYTLVEGINNNEDDNASSNGAGKTTIFESIVWGLTGSTIRGNKDVVRLGEDGCEVELTFMVDSDEYTIKRIKGKTSNLLIHINSENKSGKGIRDTEKLLEKYLPDLTSSLINSVIVLGQGLPNRFTNNTPAGRKEVLEQLSKSDYMIADLKTRVANRMSTLNSELRQLEDDIVSKKSAETVYKTTIANAKTSLENMSDITEVEAKLSEAKEKLEYNTEMLEKLKVDQEECSKQRDVTRDKISALQQDFINKSKELSQTFQETSGIVDLYSKRTDILSQKSSLEREILSLESVKDTCPTCGQKLQGVEKIDTTERREQLESITKDLTNVDNEISKLTEQNNKETSELKSKLDEEVSKLNSILTNQDAIFNGNQVSINGTESSIKACNDTIHSLTLVINDYESNKTSYNNIINEYSERLTKNAEEILYITNERDKKLEHIAIVQKFETIIKRDFRGYLLSNVINYINNKAKEYSKYIFETDKIEFIQEGNNISISYCEKEYESLSGGERQKVDLIIQFAIRDMLCNYLNFSSNILVLDEITDNLDALGCDNIINFISNNLVDISNIFIISHRAESLNVPYDNTLTIIKGRNGISTIQ